MSSNRKLQAEIERTLKKVSEGVDDFEEMMQKFHDSATQSLKEKLELELKKEIKKLQRLRDQIKGWIALNDIKDKSQLMDYRRLIEVQMEKFKVIEKEMKTKAYSREGLMASGKVDPKDKERASICQFISTCIDKLGTQIELLEGEVEAIHVAQAGGSSNGNSPVGSIHSADEAALDSKEQRIATHRMHIDKLEVILRMLQNETLAVEPVSAIKEDLDYYIDYNQEDDFMENDQLYEDLDLVEGGVAISREAQSSPEPSAEEPEAAVGTGSGGGGTAIFTAAPTPSTAPPSNVPMMPVSAGPKVPLAPSAAPSPWATAKISEVLLKAKKEALPAPKAAPSTATATPADSPTAEDQPLAAQLEKAPYPLQREEPCTAALDLQPSTPPYTFSRLKALVKATTPAPLPTEGPMHPQPVDINEFERNKPYAPSNPCTRDQHPAHYPANPPSLFEANEGIYQKFDLDTLFFIFYYQPRTLAQYFAARELKRQSWRFHKKHCAWYQRWEEPKVVNDDWELGTYVYFDYEESWSQKKKYDFTFEYRYLEDVELA